MGRLRDTTAKTTFALFARAEQLYGRTYPTPLIRFDLRGQSAGQLRVGSDQRPVIRYNPALLLRHGEDFIAETVPHEVAHYIAFVEHGRDIRPHGREWQRIVQALGGSPQRCHTYDTDGLAARRLRRYTYHCDCGEHALSSVRHNRIVRGTEYRCRRCGEPLRPGRAADPLPDGGDA